MKNYMTTEKNILGTLAFIGLALSLMACLGGCSFKVEALYHGETPIGLDNRTATQLTAVKNKPQARLVKYREPLPGEQD